jgi:hypothetical protein
LFELLPGGLPGFADNASAFEKKNQAPEGQPDGNNPGPYRLGVEFDAEDMHGILRIYAQGKMVIDFDKDHTTQK